MTDSKTIPILIDAHVHIQTIYNLNEYFDAVFNNFSKAAQKTNGKNFWVGFLLLTEVIGVNQFEKLKHLKFVGSKQKYPIELTEENNSIKLTSNSGSKVFIIAGKQIIAEDSIEVLALCTEKNFGEGLDILTTVKEINDKNGIAILPWGVGKWIGRRKEIIEKFLVEHKNEKFFLGDNSGRPTFWSEPNIFKLGNQTKHFVLPGSDALAISSEISKTASYGFYISGNIDQSRPTESIRSILTNLKKIPKHFGKLEDPISFLKNQIKMQLQKHK